MRTRGIDAESKFAAGKFGSEQEHKRVSGNEANADDEKITLKGRLIFEESVILID